VAPAPIRRARTASVRSFIPVTSVVATWGGRAGSPKTARGSGASAFGDFSETGPADQALTSAADVVRTTADGASYVSPRRLRGEGATFLGEVAEETAAERAERAGATRGVAALDGHGQAAVGRHHSGEGKAE
jgi:hypothetical protein